MNVVVIIIVYTICVQDDTTLDTGAYRYLLLIHIGCGSQRQITFTARVLFLYEKGNAV